VLKQILLATALIAAPVAGFSAWEHWYGQTANAPAAANALGDMTAFKTIVTDVQALIGHDLPGAATRITDLETAWDDAEDKLRPLDQAQWGAVDGKIDTALKSLRAATPDAAKAAAALTALQTALDDPGTAVGSGGVQSVAGIAVTDAGGHPISCEVMLKELADQLTLKPNAEAAALQAKATERCNADDDQHADAFSAQALALLR
jgi:hypothetical protein